MKDVVVLVGDPEFVRCQPFYSQSAIELSVEGDVCVGHLVRTHKEGMNDDELGEGSPNNPLIAKLPSP